MRMLKCYLANDREGHLVAVGEAISVPGQVWTCASCRGRLILHAGMHEDPWFEHDQQTVARYVLMACAYLGPEVKAEARHRELRSIINEQETTVMVLSWYCAWRGGREALCPVYDWHLQHRRRELANKLLPQVSPARDVTPIIQHNRRFA